MDQCILEHGEGNECGADQEPDIDGGDIVDVWDGVANRDHLSHECKEGCDGESDTSWDCMGIYPEGDEGCQDDQRGREVNSHQVQFEPATKDKQRLEARSLSSHTALHSLG